MKLIWANVAKTTLAGPINATTTTIVVQAGSGALFPNPGQNQYFTVTMIPASTGIPGEIMWCTGRSGDTLTVIRAQEGTTGTAYLAGDTVSNRVTAGGLLGPAQIPTYPGNPNTFLAGEAGSAEESPDFVWDTVDKALWVCVVGSSNPATTLWLQTNTYQALSANAAYFVNAATGSDSNDGKTSGTAWLTLQHAWNVISQTLNFNGFQVTVNCSGNFTAGILAQGSLVGNSQGVVGLTFSFASGATVSVTNSSCFLATIGASFTITGLSAGVSLAASGTGSNQGYGVFANGNAQIQVNPGVTFNSCGQAQMGASGAGAQININGSITTVGTSEYFIFANLGGLVAVTGSGFTMLASGTPTFSQASVFAGRNSNVSIPGTTFGSTATGQRYSAFANGVIDTNGGGATYIFGSSGGSVNLVGGVYGNGSGQYL